MTKPPSQVIINHGDPLAMEAMAQHVKELLPKATVTPMLAPGRMTLF
jgi:predicted metal-dependent RNase